MYEIIVISLALLAALYIGYPLFQSRSRSMNFDLNHRVEDLEAKKAEIYAAIKDIEFDYEMGKLSEEDYQELREQYKAQAVQILRQLDQMKSGTRRRTKAKTGQRAARFCSQCGAPAAQGDRFCANCGHPLVA